MRSGGSRKKIFGGPGPSSFGRQPRLCEITIEPISGVLLLGIGPTLETRRRAASAESARIEAPRGVGFLGGGVALPSQLEDLRERHELPQRGPGEAPAANAF